MKYYWPLVITLLAFILTAFLLYLVMPMEEKSRRIPTQSVSMEDPDEAATHAFRLEIKNSKLEAILLDSLTLNKIQQSLNRSFVKTHPGLKSTSFQNYTFDCSPSSGDGTLDIQPKKGENVRLTLFLQDKLPPLLQAEPNLQKEKFVLSISYLPL